MIRNQVAWICAFVAVVGLAGCGSDSGGGGSQNSGNGDAGAGSNDGTGGSEGQNCTTTSNYQCFNSMCRCEGSDGDYDIPEEEADEACEVTECE